VGKGWKRGEVSVSDDRESNACKRLEYRIRTSARARNVRLHVSARDGLMVVVPRGFDLRRLPAIVEGKRSWVETHLRRFSGEASLAAGAPAAELPELLNLPALAEAWQVEYHPARTCRIGVMVAEPGRLVVYGAVEDPAACIDVLKQWLQRRTRDEIVPWLVRLSQLSGLAYREAVVRGQKTRWASCSSSGTISLSYKLLFLDREAVRCVLMHELCHTAVMNHSKRFWALLSRFEPDCRAIQKRLRGGWRLVPAWVEERSG
jgi:predicted metal-dependent hydrolase